MGILAVEVLISPRQICRFDYFVTRYQTALKYATYLYYLMLVPIKMKQLLTILGLFLTTVTHSQIDRFDGVYSDGESYIKFWDDSLEFKLCEVGCDGWFCNRGLGNYYINDSIIFIETISPNRFGFSRYSQKGDKILDDIITIFFYDDLGRLHDSIIFEVYGQKWFESYSVFDGKINLDLSQVDKPREIKIRGWQDGQCCYYGIPINNILSDTIEVYLPKYSHIEKQEVKFDFILTNDSLNVRWSTYGYKPPPFSLRSKLRFGLWCFSHSWPWNYGKCELKRVNVHSNDYFKLTKN